MTVASYVPGTRGVGHIQDSGADQAQDGAKDVKILTWQMYEVLGCSSAR